MLRRIPAVRVIAALGLALTIAAAAGASGPVTVYLPLVPNNPQLTLEPVARLRGVIGAVAARPPYSFAAAGEGLQVLRHDGPAPRVVAGLALPTSPLEIVAARLVADTLYLVGVSPRYASIGKLTLLAIDVAAPEAPRLRFAAGYDASLGLYDREVVARDGSLAVATSGETLLFDITAPAAPRLTARLGGAVGVAVRGAYLFMAADGQLRVLSLADRAAPQPVRELAAPGIADLAVVGDTLYTLADLPADGSLNPDNTHELRAWSLADPGAPAPGRSIVIETGVSWQKYRIGAESDQLLVLAAPGGPSGARLMAVDVREPGAPRAGMALAPPLSPTFVASAAGRILIASEAAIAAYDATDPAQLRQLPSYVPAAPYASGWILPAGGSYAMVVGLAAPGSEPSLRSVLLDLARPAQPVVIGPTMAGPTDARPVVAAVRGDVLYVLDNVPQLRVLTGVQARALREVGALKLEGSLEEMAVSEGYAYIADSAGGILIVDLRIPERPRRLGRTPLQGRPAKIVAEGDQLYVRLLGATVEQIHFSLADPASPVEVRRTPDGYSWFPFPARGPRAYAAERAPCGRGCYYDALAVLDISAPGLPSVVGRLQLEMHDYYAPGGTDGQFTAGEDVVIYTSGRPCIAPGACPAAGVVHVIGVGAPGRPAVYATAQPDDVVYDHALIGGHIYAAAGMDGLVVYPLPLSLR